MKIFKIPVAWSVYGEIEVEAESIEQAIEKAKNDETIPLPDGYYLEDSWQIEEDEALIKAMNNL